MKQVIQQSLALIALLLTVGLGTSFSLADEPSNEKAAEDEGWDIVFDGSNTDALRDFRSNDFPKKEAYFETLD